MKRLIGVFIAVFAFVGNAVLLFGAIIVGVDLYERSREDKKNKKA